MSAAEEHDGRFSPPAARADEELRLAALADLDLLDSPPEEAFDRVTRRLADIFETPISLMSLIDRDRQWWKSSVGLPEELARAGSTPRDVAVCGHVVAGDESLVVNDLARDARFAGNPLVKELGLRFYAGAPLRADSGQPVGALCIVDTKPRQITPREQKMLEMIADDTMKEVRLRTLSRRLRDLGERVRRQHETIEADLAQARAVQRRILPPDSVVSGGWRVSHLYEPAAQVGGDFLDVLRRPDGSVAVLVADVLGHGASAALVAMMVKASFLRHAAGGCGPGQLLDALQRELAPAVPEGHFVTALAAVLEPGGGWAALASAGHPYPIVRRGGRSEVMELANGFPLFVCPDLPYETAGRVQLEGRDRLLLYTDGASEAGPSPVDSGGIIGMRGLARLFDEVPQDGPARAALGGLFDRVNRLALQHLNDDVALVCAERC